VLHSWNHSRIFRRFFINQNSRIFCKTIKKLRVIIVFRKWRFWSRWNSYLFISARSKTSELRLNSSSPDLSPSGTEIFFVFEAARMLQARIDNHNTYKYFKILKFWTYFFTFFLKNIQNQIQDVLDKWPLYKIKLKIINKVNNCLTCG